MNDNLTLGTPWKVITRFSLPVIGGNLFQLFYTLADSVIVGKILGASALAAVGATATIVYFELCFIQGLTGGFGILLGQAFGENSQKKMEESVSSTSDLKSSFYGFPNGCCLCPCPSDPWLAEYPCRYLQSDLQLPVYHFCRNRRYGLL